MIVSKCLAILFFLFLITSPALAVTYWSSPSGGAASCAAASGSSDPGVYRTLAQGLACLSSGDTLRLITGSYSSGINADNIPSGGGSYATSTKVIGAGRTLTILLPSATHGINFTAAKSYVEFSDFRINATSADNNGINFDSAGVIRIRFTRVDIYNPPNQGVLARPTASYLEFIDMDVSQAGQGACYAPRLCHSFYMWADNSILDGVIMHGNDGNGMQLYETPSNAIVRNSVAYGNTDNGIYIAGSNNRVYNNTIYNNTETGILNGGTGTIIRNNIALSNVLGEIGCGSGTCSNNITTGSPTAIWLSPSTNDFHLIAGSAAIGAGMDLSPDVTTDKDGLTRPQGGTWDAGAYEFVVSGGGSSGGAKITGGGKMTVQ